MTTKYRILSIAGFAQLATGLLGLFFIHLNPTDTIVALGIRLFKVVNGILIFQLVAGLVCLIVPLIVHRQAQKRELVSKELQKELQKDPLHDKDTVVGKLKQLQARMSKDASFDNLTQPQLKQYHQAVTHTLTQIEASEQLLYDFSDIIGSNDQPIIQQIALELNAIQVHILQEARSIYGRALIAEDYDTIEQKLNQNQRLLDDADKLIVEAINYLDVKTHSSEISLNNLIESLRDLIGTI